MPQDSDPKEVADDEETAAANSPRDVPTAFIPACGTLCDAFWWARRGDSKPSSE